MSDPTPVGEDVLGTLLWVLVAQAGHLGCGGWSYEEGTGEEGRPATAGVLRCACGRALYSCRPVTGSPDPGRPGARTAA